MSWAEYKKKREEQENAEMSYSQEIDDSNNETSSWQRYKQKREEQKTQQTETLPVANKLNTVPKTTTSLTETDLRKIEQNSGLKTGTLNLKQMQSQQQKFENLQQKGNEILQDKNNKIYDVDYIYSDLGIDNGKVFKKSSAFKDGYDFGDITKTVLDTGATLGTEVVKGVANIGENIGDLASYGIAGVADLLGKDEYADKVRKNAQVSLVDKYAKPLSSKIDKNSILGSKGKEIAQSLGYVAGTAATGAATGGTAGILGKTAEGAAKAANIATTATTFASSMGSGITEAYQNGATDQEALAYGIISGIGEAGSELMFGGLGKVFGKVGFNPTGGALDEVVVQGLSQNIKNKMVKTLVQSGLMATGEGIEEIVSGVVSAIGKKATFMKEEDLKNILKDENLAEQFWMGTLTSVIAQAPSTITSIKNKTEYLTGEKWETTQKNETPELSQNAQNNIEQKTIQTDTKTAQNQNMSQISNANENNFKNTAINEANSGQTTQNQEIPQLNNILNNKELPMQSYIYEKSDNPNVDILRKSASKYLNNSEQAHKFVQILEKISQDKNVEIRFDADLKTPEGKIANGSYSNGVITINPNSTRVGEFIAIHELTHAIGTKQMENIIEKYSKSNIEFNEETKKLLQNYSNTEMNEEALADISGQLFGTQEFINNIAQNNPNIFQKLYSEIKYLWHQFRGYKNQEQFVEDLYYKWTQAYKSNTKLNETSNKNTINFSINSNFVTEYDNWDKRNIEGSFTLGKASEALQSIGLNDYDIVMDKTKIIDILNKHPEMNDNLIKQIPNILENPTLILKSQTVSGRIVVFSEVTATDGKPVLVAMELNPAENKNNIEKIYKIASAYGRQNVMKMQDWLNNTDNILYIDKQKNRTMNWLNGLGLQLPVPNNLSSSINSIASSNKDVNTTTKYSMQESEKNSDSFNLSKQDNKGRTLTKEQQEYFKDSKVRDENGNLKEIYHGSNTDGITIFDIDKTSEDNVFGKGFYFTDNKLMAESYAEEAVDYNGGTKQIYKGYLNIKNPFVVEGENTVDLANKIKNIDYNADIIDENYGVASTEKMKEWLINKGYDGIEVKLEKGDGSYYVAFNSNQIKNVDNTNPTNNPDIRYSIQNNSSWQDYLEKNYKTAGTRTNFEDISKTKKNKKNIVENKLPTAQQKTQSLPIGEYTGKQRKHYKSIMESSNTTPQAKKIAKELLNSDTYIPETNKGQLERADARIMSSTPESELNSLNAKAINGEKITSIDIAVGERLIEYYSKTGNAVKLQEAIQTTAMAGTSAGQTVQALSLLNHQTPQGQAMWLQKSVDKMNNELARRKGGKIKKDENGNIRVVNNKGVDITEKVELFNLTPEMIEDVVSSKNDVELSNNLNKVYEQLGQQVTRTTAQKIDAWRYFSMLANPRTHIRNITGNLAMGGVQGIKNKVAGAIEGVVSKINPDMERSHTIKKASKEVKAFAKADIENVTDRLGLSENKYNPKTRLENSMRTFKSDVMENTIGKMFDLNNKALEVEDGWGLKAGYAKALSDYMTANNLTPDTITDKQLGKARNYAIQQAKEATFHQDSSIASALNQFSNKNKFSKFFSDAIIPFKKTPINVAKAGLEYSPIGLVKSAINDTVQLRKGNITVNTYIDNISKGLTGTGIALMGYFLADCGILKATGSDDDDREKFEESRGSQNYSVKIGDNTYSLDWLAPSGIPLFIGAECYELMQAQKEKKTSSSDEDELYNKAINTATNILDSFANAMNPMTEMSMLSGLTSALKSYDQDSSKMLASIGTNAVKSYVNQFVPTALGQVAKTTDQYERSTTSTQKGVLPKAIDTTRTQIMNKIPGLRQMLPIKTDIWGNEIEQSDNVIQRAFENAVFPWARKELNSNSVDQELVKVYKNTGDKAVLPDGINKEITINKQKYTMTSGEYSKYKKQYGENSYKLLNSLVTANGYKKMSDEEKRVAISKIYSYATEQIKVDYAKQNGLEYEQSTLSQVTNAIKKVNGNTSNYFEFIAKTQELDKDIEKIKTLANSNYDENTKKAIYENSLGKRDNKFNIMKETFTTNGLNTTKYLKYKSQEFEPDKTDDGTLNGKTVNGSKKKKVWNYIEQMDITYTQKLLLYGLEYTPSNREQTQIVNYINSLPKTQQEKLEMLSKFQGFTIYKDGTFKY